MLEKIHAFLDIVEIRMSMCEGVMRFNSKAEDTSLEVVPTEEIGWLGEG